MAFCCFTNFLFDSLFQKPPGFSGFEKGMKKNLGFKKPLFIISIIFIINNWPYTNLLFDQYHKPLGTTPYQNFIDYITKRGSIVFWAHPEAENISKGKGQHRNQNVRARGHGHKKLYRFTIFQDGYNIIGKTGGVWDGLLQEYCREKREKTSMGYCGRSF